MSRQDQDAESQLALQEPKDLDKKTDMLNKR